MPDYSSTYLGRDPGELEDEKRKKKLQTMFRPTEQVMGMDSQQASPLAAGSPLGMKKSVFGGGTKAPDLFGGTHEKAVANAPDPYAGIKEGFKAVKEAREEGEAAPEEKKKAPEDVSNDDRATPEEREENPTDIPTDVAPGPGSVAPVPEVAPDRPRGGGPIGPDAYEPPQLPSQQIQEQQQAQPPRGGGPIPPDVTEERPMLRRKPQEAPVPGPGRAPEGGASPEAAAAAMQAAQQKAPQSRGMQASQNGTPQARAPKKLEGSRKTLEDIKKLREAPDEPAPPWHKRFGESANVTEVTKDWQKRGQPRGQEGLMAEILGKGLRGVFDKKGYAAAQKQKKMDALFKRYESEMEFEKGERGRTSEEESIKQNRAKPFEKAAWEDEQITQAESDKFRDEYGMDVPPTNARTVQHRKVGGVWKSGYDKGEGDAGVYSPNKSLGTEPGEEYYEVDVNGKKLPSTAKDIVTSHIQSGRQTAQITATREGQEATREAAGDKSRGEAKAEAAGLQVKVTDLESQIAALGANDEATGSLRSQLSEAKGKLATAKLNSLGSYQEVVKYLMEGKSPSKKKYTETEAAKFLKGKQGTLYK